jgi:adenylate cyclase class 2
MNTQEIEVKFYLAHPEKLQQSLLRIGAAVKEPRVHEINLRFDTPDGKLAAQHHVLRLRKDRRARLTFKGPADPQQPVSVRQEIEFEVSNLEAAQRFLEALGYQVSIIYEKYRTTYAYQDTEIALDEMPYGNFLEIEGPGTEAIQSTAALLGLDWEARSILSYLALFDHLRQTKRISPKNLTFEELAPFTVQASDLGLSPADK